MSMKRDYYEILGESRAATTQEIHRAFRRRARELHPDINPSPEATRNFQELNEAHQILSNPPLRAQYDRLGYSPRPRPSPPASASAREEQARQESVRARARAEQAQTEQEQQEWAQEWAQARARAEQARQEKARAEHAQTGQGQQEWAQARARAEQARRERAERGSAVKPARARSGNAGLTDAPVRMVAYILFVLLTGGAQSLCSGGTAIANIPPLAQWTDEARFALITMVAIILLVTVLAIVVKINLDKRRK